MALRNPFDHPLAGRLYAKGRPTYHASLVPFLQERLGLHQAVPFAVDAGCGTGQSAAAIRSLARFVLGVDSSRAMLSHAERAEGVAYALAAAEALPVRDGAVDLVTCGAAFHWFRREAFFSELRRVLRAGGAAVLYDNFFGRGSTHLLEWHRDVFVPKFPKPPRNEEFRASVGEKEGFRVRGPESRENGVVMDLDALTGYLLTQSNLLSALPGDSNGFRGAERWLRSEVTPFFRDAPSRIVWFSSRVWILDR